MKDIASFLAAKEAKARELMNQMFGPSADLAVVSRVMEGLLPEPARELEELCKFFEAEMLRCRDAGAYFFGCIAGAAMIESFLLSICVLEKEAVERSNTFQRFRNRKKGDYERVVVDWTLKELIPVTEELKWIGRDVVDQSLVRALVDGYREMLPAARPDVTDAELRSVLALLQDNPDVAFLSLMQSMRNLVHGGRCVRLRKRLSSPDFSDWAKLVMVLTVEIRDCLLMRLGSIYQRYLTKAISSPAGASAVMNLFARFAKTENLARALQNRK